MRAGSRHYALRRCLYIDYFRIHTHKCMRYSGLPIQNYLCKQENDIVLCDGACNRAYHANCLQPPLDPGTLVEEEGWLCPACDAKVKNSTIIYKI